MKFKELSVLFIMSFFIVLFSRHIGMFWDNVLYGSKIGTYLFDNGFFEWDSIPLSIDNGHPPFLATILAISWKIFGRSLEISHWVMFPFIVGLLYQIYSFISYFISQNHLRICAFFLVLADPTLLSQLVLVNPEVIQSFFFFLALNAILRNRLPLKIVGLSFLGLITFRGMLLCGGLFLVDVLIFTLVKKRKIQDFFSKQVILIYLISALPALLYIIWRLALKGWIISHPLEIWGNATEFNSIHDFLMNFGRNTLVLGFQFSDFGRLVLLIFIVLTLYFKRGKKILKSYKYLLIIGIFSTSLIYGTNLVLRNTMGHRYYLVSYLSLALLAFLLLNEYRRKKIIFSLMIASLLLGNLMVYPDSFAQGWDSSLAHLPYWRLRKKAINYMDNRKIDIKETASFFPNKTTIDNIDLNGDLRFFKGFSGNEKYVFYSNVYNLSDEDLKILDNNYLVIKTFEKNAVRVDLMIRVNEFESNNELRSIN